MNINRPLMPGFLKKAEQKLLLNKPGIWSTRTHLVLYYGVLFILFLAALCFLEPNDVRNYSTTEYWIGFVSIISVIGLVVWLIYLLRFNVFKKYGNIHSLNGLGTFLLYFISTGIIVLFNYVHPVVESVRANMAYDDEEIVQDINSMNLKICQLEYDLLQGHWSYDTVAKVKSKTPAEPPSDYEEIAVADTIVEPVKVLRAFPYYQLDSTAFHDRLATTDSLVKINDTVYLTYKTPDYKFVDAYMADNFTKEHILSAFEIYKKVLRHPPAPAERVIISKELSVLINKYHRPENLRKYDRAAQIDDNDTPFEIINKKYKLGEIHQNISNVVEKKYRWKGKHLPDFIRLFYYVTLGITLLIFIFRHSTIRTFFLSLLTGVLLTIFTALMIAFFRYDASGFFILMIVYAVLFLLGSLLAWSNKKRKAVTGILTNLFVFIAPVLPLLIFGWYYNWKKELYYKQEPPIVETFDLDQYFIYPEIGGVLLLLILLATYIGKVYRRWYSLPED